MRRATRGDLKETRMLTIRQACAYTGLGQTTLRSWCKEIGATRKIGRTLRFDKVVIDQELDTMALQARQEAAEQA